MSTSNWTENGEPLRACSKFLRSLSKRQRANHLVHSAS